jgi:hypothetical protein
MVALLGLQVLAVILYPPAFLRSAPQAAVLPPTLLILFAVALITTNTGALSLIAGRNSLTFVQGINVVVRLMMLLPNLKNSAGEWDWVLLILQSLCIALSWFCMIEMAKRPLRTLLITRHAPTA